MEINSLNDIDSRDYRHSLFDDLLSTIKTFLFSVLTEFRV